MTTTETGVASPSPTDPPARPRRRPRRSLVLVVAAVVALVVAGLAAGGRHTSRPVVLPEVTLRCDPQTGAPAGPTACPAGPGGSVRLRGLTGMPTLVNIWASWCEGCTKELPAVERLARRTRGRLRVIGVASVDKRSDLLEAVRRYGLTYPSLDDPDGDLAHGLGLFDIPATLLISPAGKVVTLYNSTPLDDAALARLVRRLGVRA